MADTTFDLKSSHSENLSETTDTESDTTMSSDNPTYGEPGHQIEGVDDSEPVFKVVPLEEVKKYIDIKVNDKEWEGKDTSLDFVYCSKCNMELKKGTKKCRRCKNYIPSPGEVFEAHGGSGVSFHVPSLWQDMKSQPVSGELHDIPPPSIYYGVTPELQEWVLNKLPLKEDQKNEFIKGMQKDKNHAERKDELLRNSQDRVKQLQDEVRSERPQQKTSASGGAFTRQSVKNSKKRYNIRCCS